MTGETKGLILFSLKCFNCRQVIGCGLVWKVLFRLAKVSSLVLLILLKDGTQGESNGGKGVLWRDKIRWKILLQFFPKIPQSFLRIVLTPQRTKTNSLHVKKTISISIIISNTYRRYSYFHRGAPWLMLDGFLKYPITFYSWKFCGETLQSWTPLAPHFSWFTANS